MVIKAKSPLLLFVFSFCLCSALLSLGCKISRQRTALDQCIDQCREEEVDVSGLFACAARCERKFSAGWEPDGSGRDLKKCQQRCRQSKEGGRRQQQDCQRRCEEQVREGGREQREREQEREREQREREREQEREQQRERREREEREQREEEQEREQREEELEREQREKEREREQREEEQEEEPDREQQRGHREREERVHRREREGEQREEEQEREREERERQRERERKERERDRERERENQISESYSQTLEEECRQLCRKQAARQQPQCHRSCKRQYESLKRKQEDHRNHHIGIYGENHHEPHQSYEQCRKQCERQERGEQHQQQCKSWCDQQREKEVRRRKGEQNPQRESRAEEEQQKNNPYYFHAQRFRYWFRSQEGHLKVLQRFSERSELLLGIDNYRLGIAEANPSTLVVPHHSDAETILVVLRGRGIITLVSQEKRESFNIELGEVLRVPAGTTLYLINQDSNEKLQVAELIHSVNTPGQFRNYFAAGGGNPESYYKVFSYDILTHALNTPNDQLDRLFEGQQRQQGAIRRATPEQLRALSQHSSPKQQGKESRGPINLLSQKPLYHNNFGRFFEASPNDYRQLQEMDVSVAYVEIKQGAMMVPHYNSKSTTIVLVVEGRGRLEMGCPHLSRQTQGSQERRERGEEEEESSGQLQKITAQLSPGDVFIIPAGHPIALSAQNENLRTVGFGVNALNNQRTFLAGKINIMNQVEKDAMEIAFNVPARLVERIFSNNPKESYFVAGPELAGPEEVQQGEEGRGHSLSSVLDTVGFF